MPNNTEISTLQLTKNYVENQSEALPIEIPNNLQSTSFEEDECGDELPMYEALTIPEELMLIEKMHTDSIAFEIDELKHDLANLQLKHGESIPTIEIEIKSLLAKLDSKKNYLSYSMSYDDYFNQKVEARASIEVDEVDEVDSGDSSMTDDEKQLSADNNTPSHDNKLEQEFIVPDTAIITNEED